MTVAHRIQLDPHPCRPIDPVERRLLGVLIMDGNKTARGSSRASLDQCLPPDFTLTQE
jgi:hypothetical protein